MSGSPPAPGVTTPLSRRHSTRQAIGFAVVVVVLVVVVLDGGSSSAATCPNRPHLRPRPLEVGCTKRLSRPSSAAIGWYTYESTCPQSSSGMNSASSGASLVRTVGLPRFRSSLAGSRSCRPVTAGPLRPSASPGGQLSRALRRWAMLLDAGLHGDRTHVRSLLATRCRAEGPRQRGLSPCAAGRNGLD